MEPEAEKLVPRFSGNLREPTFELVVPFGSTVASTATIGDMVAIAATVDPNGTRGRKVGSSIF